jgi:L-alanine-DL-glutamate epimerase-like enolase superfamily enzyme
MPTAVTIDLAKVEAWALRAPIAVPVRSSFGEMRNRPAVFVRVRDRAGHVGWGEAWCNFPPVGAEHRARLVNELVGPVLCKQGEQPLADLFARLMKRFHIMVLQSGEFGPFRQVCAAIDIACHDLAARRAGLPLWRFLGGVSDRIPVYASGIACEDVDVVAPRELAAGHRAFKLKIGFGDAVDRDGLKRLRQQIGRDCQMMADANQAWNLAQAAVHMPSLDEFALTWLEEPMAADRPMAEWVKLAASTGIPIAAGENLNSHTEFDAAISSSAIAYIQPDAAKWGGMSGCLAVARQAVAAGRVYCPHYLGGGIGLLASAHLLAAAGGSGLLEIDTNPNPWRERIVGDRLKLDDGVACLGEAPGLGVDPTLLDLPLA